MALSWDMIIGLVLVTIVLLSVLFGTLATTGVSDGQESEITTAHEEDTLISSPVEEIKTAAKEIKTTVEEIKTAAEATIKDVTEGDEPALVEEDIAAVTAATTGLSTVMEDATKSVNVVLTDEDAGEDEVTTIIEMLTVMEDTTEEAAKAVTEAVEMMEDTGITNEDLVDMLEQQQIIDNLTNTIKEMLTAMEDTTE